jgi:hypothetical protein
MKRYRYRIKRDHYLPEYSTDKGVTWKEFDENTLKNELLEVGVSLARLGGYGLFYSNTKTAFFTKEYLVTAFLSAAKTLDKEVVVDITNQDETEPT